MPGSLVETRWRRRHALLPECLACRRLCQAEQCAGHSGLWTVNLVFVDRGVRDQWRTLFQQLVDLEFGYESFCGCLCVISCSGHPERPLQDVASLQKLFELVSCVRGSILIGKELMGGQRLSRSVCRVDQDIISTIAADLALLSSF